MLGSIDHYQVLFTLHLSVYGCKLDDHEIKENIFKFVGIYDLMKTAQMFLLNAENLHCFSFSFCITRFSFCITGRFFSSAVVIQNKVIHHETDESKMKQ